MNKLTILYILNVFGMFYLYNEHNKLKRRTKWMFDANRIDHVFYDKEHDERRKLQRLSFFREIKTHPLCFDEEL